MAKLYTSMLPKMLDTVQLLHNCRIYTQKLVNKPVTKVSRKNTFTGLLTNFCSFTPFSYKLRPL